MELKRNTQHICMYVCMYLYCVWNKDLAINKWTLACAIISISETDTIRMGTEHQSHRQVQMLVRHSVQMAFVELGSCFAYLRCG